MGKKIVFDLEDFKIWIEDLIDVDFPNCSKWDTIDSWYKLKETGELVYMHKWENYKEKIEEEIEIVLRGKIVNE